jgi:hypothetical protein
MLRGEHGIWAGTSPKDATLGEPGWRLDAVLALDDYIDD